MMWVVFTAFILVAAYCEFRMFRLVSQAGVNQWVRYIYIGVTATVWAATLFVMLRMRWAGDIGNGFTRVAGVVMLLFLFNGVSKALYLLFYGLGRVAGKTRPMLRIGGILIGLTGLGILYGATVGRSALRVERETFLSQRVPPAFDGYRIAIISDLHTGLLIGQERLLTRVTDAVNRLNPDMVINAGDIVNYDYRELDGNVLGILSQIEARDGVYAVLGNHDLGIYVRDTVTNPSADNIERIAAAQRSLGWKVLCDSSALLVREGDTLSITGLGFPEELLHRSHKRLTPKLNISDAYEGLPSGVFNITVSHAPQAWESVTSVGRGDITVSGHVHSLQMKVSFGRCQWSPAAWLYDRWSGPYYEDGKLLYINDGIGYAMVPIRIGTRPEITLLELRRDEGNNIGSRFE